VKWGGSAAPPERCPGRRDPSPTELLLDGLALIITDGLAAAAPTLRQAVSLFAGDGISAGDRLRRGWIALAAPLMLWDYEGYRAILARQVDLIRSAGALDRLPIELVSAGLVAAWSGDFGLAATLNTESELVCEATGSRIAPYAALMLACLRGNQAEVTPLIDSMTSAVEGGGQGLAGTAAHWTAAILYNGLGHYEQALEAAQQAVEDPTGLCMSLWAMPELIEAAARSGNMRVAGDALALLAETSQAGGYDWGLGLEARSRALVAGDGAAEGWYREAIERLAALSSARISPAPTCSTASGCATRAAALTRGNSCAPPTRCWTGWGCGRSPNELAAS
jgi:hypothetical protein